MTQHVTRATSTSVIRRVVSNRDGCKELMDGYKHTTESLLRPSSSSEGSFQEKLNRSLFNDRRNILLIRSTLVAQLFLTRCYDCSYSFGIH